MTKLETESKEESEIGLGKIIEVCGDFYVLKKRIAYFIDYTVYVVVTAKNKVFQRSNLNATYFNCALTKVVKCVQ